MLKIYKKGITLEGIYFFGIPFFNFLLSSPLQFSGRPTSQVIHVALSKLETKLSSLARSIFEGLVAEEEGREKAKSNRTPTPNNTKNERERERDEFSSILTRTYVRTLTVCYVVCL